MKKLFFSLLAITVLIAACTPKENPFMPKPKDKADYAFSIAPTGIESSMPDWWFQSACYSDYPYIAGYTVYSTMDPGLPLDQWPEYVQKYPPWDNDPPDSKQRRNGMLVYNLSEQFNTNISGGSTISFVNFQMAGEESRYSYTYPVIVLTVSDSETVNTPLFLERFYKIRAFDIYGRKTDFQIQSIKYCRVWVECIIYDEYGMNIQSGTVGGRVISYLDPNYSVQLMFDDWFLSELSRGQQCEVNQIQIWDFAGNGNTFSNGTNFFSSQFTVRSSDESGG